jgi:hypothetical protein
MPEKFTGVCTHWHNAYGWLKFDRPLEPWIHDCARC